MKNQLMAALVKLQSKNQSPLVFWKRVFVTRALIWYVM